jgi:hypothetical protein
LNGYSLSAVVKTKTYRQRVKQAYRRCSWSAEAADGSIVGAVTKQKQDLDISKERSPFLFVVVFSCDQLVL